jgi:hypothetical protein
MYYLSLAENIGSLFIPFSGLERAKETLHKAVKQNISHIKLWDARLSGKTTRAANRQKQTC